MIRERVKSILSNNTRISKTIRKMINEGFCLVSLISPKINCVLRYRYAYGKSLNINHPTTFIEKCNWYKVNIVNKYSIFRVCSDKYAVRSYVKQKGCGETLNRLIAVYDRIDDINFDVLPEKYVIKLNDGSGYYIICTDRNLFDENEAKSRLKKWWNEHNYLLYAELQNKAKKRKILIEEYLGGYNGSKQPIDYKIYCFNGIPKAILCVWDRDSKTKELFMDPEWNYISEAYDDNLECKGDSRKKSIPKPKDLEAMLKYARILSNPFPFVRCDFYQTDNGPIFGELTFTAAGGMFTSQTDPKVLDMSKLLQIPCNFRDIKLKGVKKYD